MSKNSEQIICALIALQKHDWDTAHNIAQSSEGEYDYDRIHALCHRIEGDTFNARYWYKRCNLEIPKISIEEEIIELLATYSV